MTTQKKFANRLVTFGLIFTLVLTLFATVASSQPKEKEGWPKKIVIGVTGGETGPAYPWLSGLGQMVEKYLGVSVNLTSISGHDGTNLMYRGQLHVLFPSGHAVMDLLRGLGPTKAWGPTPARAWIQAQLVGADFIVLDKSGIKTFADFEGKIVCIGPRASPVSDFIMGALSAAYGFDLKKFPMENSNFARTKLIYGLYVDARVNHGNSGGPVYIASTGKVIGIASAFKSAPIEVKDKKGENVYIRDFSFWQNSGLTYVVPSRSVIELLKKNKISPY